MGKCLIVLLLVAVHPALAAPRKTTEPTEDPNDVEIRALKEANATLRLKLRQQEREISDLRKQIKLLRGDRRFLPTTGPARTVRPGQGNRPRPIPGTLNIDQLIRTIPRKHADAGHLTTTEYAELQRWVRSVSARKPISAEFGVSQVVGAEIAARNWSLHGSALHNNAWNGGKWITVDSSVRHHGRRSHISIRALFPNPPPRSLLGIKRGFTVTVKGKLNKVDIWSTKTQLMSSVTLTDCVLLHKRPREAPE